MIHFADRLKQHFVPQHSPIVPRAYCVNSKIVTDTYRVENSSSIVPASSIATSIQALHAADFSLDFQQAAGNPINSLLFPCSLQNTQLNLATIFARIEQQQRQIQQPKTVEILQIKSVLMTVKTLITTITQQQPTQQRATQQIQPL